MNVPARHQRFSLRRIVFVLSIVSLLLVPVNWYASYQAGVVCGMFAGFVVVLGLLAGTQRQAPGENRFEPAALATVISILYALCAKL
jgi:hypothetical protein